MTQYTIQNITMKSIPPSDIILTFDVYLGTTFVETIRLVLASKSLNPAIDIPDIISRTMQKYSINPPPPPVTLIPPKTSYVFDTTTNVLS